MNDKPAFDIEADSKCAPVSDALARVTQMVKTMADASALVDDLTTRLAAAKSDLKRIEQDDFPDLMRELGIADIKLEDGSRVEVVDDVHCGISEDRRAEAHAWLTANGRTSQAPRVRDAGKQGQPVREDRKDVPPHPGLRHDAQAKADSR